MARPRIASPRRQTWRRNFKLNSRGSSAASTLQSAGAYLNRQLAFYGEAQDRIAAATDLAQKFQTQQQGQLSSLRDADIPTVAVQLSQSQLDQQAALSAEANIAQQKNLFSYLG